VVGCLVDQAMSLSRELIWNNGPPPVSRTGKSTSWLRSHMYAASTYETMQTRSMFVCVRSRRTIGRGEMFVCTEIVVQCGRRYVRARWHGALMGLNG